MSDPLSRWLDGRAAVRATLVAVLAVVLLVSVQGAVSAALTTGSQPMPRVESVPETPTANAWEQAPSRTVTLSKQQMAIPYGGGSVDELSVRALTNETHVAFRLSWHDPTNDTSLSSPRRYSDAAAIMLHSGQVPPITMGAAGDPVNIWYWRAAWQYGGPKQAEWSGDMYAYPHPDNETKPGLAADNPLSKVHYEQFAQNYYARGYGSLSYAPRQNVQARAVRDGNEWTVTFVRERETGGTHDAVFGSGKPMYLAFAVWNGSADEVNGQKSITLQFTTLEQGELSSAQSGGSGDGGDSGGQSAGGATSGGGGPGGSTDATDELTGYLSTLVAVTVVAWLVTYWRGVR